MATINRDRVGRSLDPLAHGLAPYVDDIMTAAARGAERAMATELGDVRNKWAHQDAFHPEDT